MHPACGSIRGFRGEERQSLCRNWSGSKIDVDRFRTPVCFGRKIYRDRFKSPVCPGLSLIPQGFPGQVNKNVFQVRFFDFFGALKPGFDQLVDQPVGRIQCDNISRINNRDPVA